MNRCLLALSLISIGLLSHARLHAQAPVYKGDTLPVSSGLPAWFLDTVTHRAYMDAKEYWQLLPVQPVIDIIACSGETIVVTKRGYERWQNAQAPEEIFAKVICADSSYFAIADESEMLRWIKPAEEKKFNFNGWLPVSKSIEPQRVRGKVVYCVPYLGPGIGYLGSEIRNWGMMSADGTWVVAPKFDTAFKFKKGFADVLYYGQRHKINERGVFIE